MSQICRTLEGCHYKLVVANVNGTPTVKAQRTKDTKVSGSAATRMLTELARKQAEALVYLAPRAATQSLLLEPSKYHTQELWQIEQTLARGGICAELEAQMIYEYNDLLHRAGLGGAKSSDGFTWADLVKKGAK